MTASKSRTVSVRTQPVSLGEALQATQQRLLQPAWLPSPALILANVQLAALPAGGDSRAALTVLEYKEAPGRWIVIKQEYLASHNQEFIGPVEHGTIRGQPAIFTSFTVEARSLPSKQLLILACYWQEEGRLRGVQAAGFSREDMVRVAESLI